jgi:hypothetical protein
MSTLTMLLTVWESDALGSHPGCRICGADSCNCRHGSVAADQPGILIPIGCPKFKRSAGSGTSYPTVQQL